MDTIKPWIFLRDNISVNCLLLANCLCNSPIQMNEEHLQRALSNLRKLFVEYKLKISVSKTNAMAFEGIESTENKIMIESRILGQLTVSLCII